MEIDGGDEGSNNNNSAKDDLAAESSMDSTFQKFADRLEQNPEQVLRYEFRGSPLLYSKTDAVGKKLAAATEAKVQISSGGMPRCGNCGAERVFEVQLTPHAITELEAEELGIEGMEWGTV
ncbi:MAG: programmed cell death 2 domain-containing protein, partial [Janthinobacterium lividum]